VEKEGILDYIVRWDCHAPINLGSQWQKRMDSRLRGN